LPLFVGLSTLWATDDGFLSDERIFAFGCWIFLDGKETVYNERAAPPPFGSRHEEEMDFPVYRLLYESTIDLLVQYFLPEFDKSIIDGRVLAQTTLSTNSLFFCFKMTAVGDCIFNLLPMPHSDLIRYFVFRYRCCEESLIKDITDEIKLKLFFLGDRYQRLRRHMLADFTDSAVTTCSFVGETYGMINMYRDHRWFEPKEWRR
jgi:hypothetical protein